MKKGYIIVLKELMAAFVKHRKDIREIIIIALALILLIIMVNSFTCWQRANAGDDSEADTPDKNEFDVGCRVYRNQTTGTGTGILGQIYFDSEYYDTDNMHSVSSDVEKVYCVKEGKYYIQGSFQWQGNEAGYRQIEIKVNGVIVGANKECPGVPNDFRQQADAVVDMIKGDVVELFFLQASGVALAIYHADDYSPILSVQRIGVGGESMEMNVVFPVNYWIFGAACIMLLFAVFFKKLLLYIALVPLWMGVIATAGNPYIDASAGIVLLFAIISLRSIAKKTASGGV